MRLVVNIFDHRTAYTTRKRDGAFVSKSAVSGADLASLDTYTGLPYELEQEILARYHDLERRTKLPSDIWQDLSDEESFSSVASEDEHHAHQPQSGSLNAQAAEFTPGQQSQAQLRKKSIGISQTIQPVFSPIRSLDWRFGFIEVDYLESPVRMNYRQQHPTQMGNARSPMSPSRTLELPAIFEMRSRSNSRAIDEEPPDEAARSPRSPGGGTLDLGFGVIHLYKDHSDEQDVEAKSDGGRHSKAASSSSPNGQKQASGAGSMVAILGVPSNWSTADFLAFIDDSVDSLHQMRIMR